MALSDSDLRRYGWQLMVEMIPVSSSSVAAVGYDEQSGDLFVEYISSGTYIYAGVTMPVFEDWSSSRPTPGHISSPLQPADRANGGLACALRRSAAFAALSNADENLRHRSCAMGEAD
jgi:hypothetical protein